MTGERKERTEWHNVVINGEGLVGVVRRYLKKGSKVYIEAACAPANGRIATATTATRPKS